MFGIEGQEGWGGQVGWQTMTFIGSEYGAVVDVGGRACSKYLRIYGEGPNGGSTGHPCSTLPRILTFGTLRRRDRIQDSGQVWLDLKVSFVPSLGQRLVQ